MKIIKFLQNRLKISSAFIILAGIFCFFVFGFLQETKYSPALASLSDITSPDAIAVRIIPNPDHYGISRWYKEQGFKGSPQAITVDGYEALRDGRTVYINAANVEGGNLYLNIYFISYNQEAESATESILEQIIAHFKFNVGIENFEQKSAITRDTKRLSDLADIKIAVENYKRIHGYYPKLEAGSYLSNKTVSTWPSWQQTLAKELETSLPDDPINKLGVCPGYDPNTCWSETKKAFADPTPANSEFNLPSGSKAFVYSALADGSNYNVCAVMESGYITGLESGACAGSATIKGTSPANNLPAINCGNLSGISRQAFKGYISADDPDGDELVWGPINTKGTAWTGWSSAPTLKPTVNTNQKEIFASQAGNQGTYDFIVAVDDGKGGSAIKTCSIKINLDIKCYTKGICDGNCPENCTIAEDPDCSQAGCYGNQICEPTVDCSAGPKDCTFAQCCGNGVCDLKRGENSTNCLPDCPAPGNKCKLPFTLPCVFGGS